MKQPWKPYGTLPYDAFTRCLPLTAHKAILECVLHELENPLQEHWTLGNSWDPRLSSDSLQIPHRLVAIGATALLKKMLALSISRGAHSILLASDATPTVTGPWVPLPTAVRWGCIKATQAMKLESPDHLTRNSSWKIFTRYSKTPITNKQCLVVRHSNQKCNSGYNLSL